MDNRFSRTEILIGDNKLELLKSKNILIVGVGGVGGYAAEIFVRSGIGNITIVDGDIVDITNINRQIIATTRSVGRLKVDVFGERLIDINPELNIRCLPIRFNEITLNEIFDRDYDYVIDAIDSIKDKVLLIKTAKEKCIPIISAMGAGNRYFIGDFEIKDIFSTANDGLAKKLRKLLRDEGISDLKVVCSKTPAFKNEGIIGSIAYMPALSGIKMAGYVICEFINGE